MHRERGRYRCQVWVVRVGEQLREVPIKRRALYGVDG